MAIEIVSVRKMENGIYAISVQDTGDQVGVDDKLNPIYRTYSVRHNPNDVKLNTLNRLKAKIKAQRSKSAAEDLLKSNIATDLASIDPLKL